MANPRLAKHVGFAHKADMRSCPTCAVQALVGCGSAPVHQSTVRTTPDGVRGAQAPRKRLRAKRRPQPRTMRPRACVEARTACARDCPRSVVGKASPYRGAASCRGARECVQAEVKRPEVAPPSAKPTSWAVSRQAWRRDARGEFQEQASVQAPCSWKRPSQASKYRSVQRRCAR